MSYNFFRQEYHIENGRCLSHAVIHLIFLYMQKLYTQDKLHNTKELVTIEI